MKCADASLYAIHSRICAPPWRFARVLVALLVCTSACSRASTQVAVFDAPLDTFRLETKTLALVPIRLPTDLDVIPDSIALIYDSLIRDALRQANLDVVPAAVYGGIWRRLTYEAGGFYDPYTGRFDEVEFETAERQLYQEMQNRFAPEAYVHPEIVVVDAVYVEGVALWDGVAQPVSEEQVTDGLAPAFSLFVSVEDTTGAELYFNGAGVEVYRELGEDADVLADTRRREHAVRAVLAPLLSKIPPAADTIATDRNPH